MSRPASDLVKMACADLHPQVDHAWPARGLHGLRWQDPLARKMPERPLRAQGNAPAKQEPTSVALAVTDSSWEDVPALGTAPNSPERRGSACSPAAGLMGAVG